MVVFTFFVYGILFLCCWTAWLPIVNLSNNGSTVLSLFSNCSLAYILAVVCCSHIPPRSKLRLKEGNAKCLYETKIDLQRDFAAGVYLPEVQNPIPPPPYTLYTCIQYTYSHWEGRGRVEPERGRGATCNISQKQGRNYYGLYLQPINYDKHLSQSPFIGPFFKMTTF